MKIEIEFIEPLLGTLPGNKEIAEEFVIAKHPDGHCNEESDAVPTVEEELEKARTFFARDREKNPFLWDYQIKGFFKEACLAMIETDLMTKAALKAVRLTPYLYRRTVDKQIFVKPRRIMLKIPNNMEMKFCERPLRAETMKGARVCLASAQQAPTGTSIKMEIIIMNKKLKDFICKWLDFGALSGLGQWRNSGMGRFNWRLLKE